MPPPERLHMVEIRVTTDIEFVDKAGCNGRATVAKPLLKFPRGTLVRV